MDTLAPSELSLALLQVINTKLQRENFKFRVDQNQNTETVSTPAKEVTKKSFQVTKIMIEGTKHPMELYGLAPDDAGKGVIPLDGNKVWPAESRVGNGRARDSRVSICRTATIYVVCVTERGHHCHDCSCVYIPRE